MKPSQTTKLQGPVASWLVKESISHRGHVPHTWNVSPDWSSVGIHTERPMGQEGHMGSGVGISLSNKAKSCLFKRERSTCVGHAPLITILRMENGRPLGGPGQAGLHGKTLFKQKQINEKKWGRCREGRCGILF